MSPFRRLLLIFSGFFLFGTVCASAQIDLSKILGGLGGGSSESSSSVGDVIGGVIGNLFSSGNITVDQLKGTWNYSAPAVSFKSDDLLKKAGGSAISGAIESKLAPYYNKAQLNKMVLTINADSTFTMSLGKTSLKGTISSEVPQGSSANFVFKFQVAGMNVGGVDTYITLSGSTMNLMFDVSKLIQVVKAVSSVANNSTLNSVTSLLQSYDGICAGFKLTRRN